MFNIEEELIDMGPPDVGSVGGSAWVEPDTIVRRPRGKRKCSCVPDVISITGHIYGCYTCEGADEVCFDETHSTNFDNIPDEFFSIGIDSDDGVGNCVFYLKQAGESNWLEFSFGLHVVFTQNDDGTGSVVFTSNPCGGDGSDTIFTVNRDAPDGIRGTYSVDFTGIGSLVYHFEISIPTSC